MFSSSGCAAIYKTVPKKLSFCIDSYIWEDEGVFGFWACISEKVSSVIIKENITFFMCLVC